jgi:hypothetical protein
MGRDDATQIHRASLESTEKAVIRQGNKKEEGMRSDVEEEHDEKRSSEEIIDPDLENEEEEARHEYGQSEAKPQLTLVKPKKQGTEKNLPDDQGTEIGLSDEDPPGWPEF